MQLENEKHFVFDILAGHSQDIVLQPRDSSAFFTFDIITQNGNGIDDIIVKVLDEINYAKWEIISKVSQPNTLPQYTCYVNIKIHFGTIMFSPPVSGIYHLLLDNTYSVMTAKHVDIKINVLSFETQMRHISREAVNIYGLKDFWRYYEDAETQFYNGKYSTACDCARKALIVLWTKVGENLARTKIVFDESKSTDIKQLKDVLYPYAPNYIISQITQAWALASELSHAEKRDGKEPAQEEARFAVNSTFAAIAYLCTLFPRS